MNLAQKFQERMQGLYPSLLGVEFTDVGTERVRAELTVRPDICNVFGVLHGGAVMGFADTLGAVATIVNLPQGARTATIESKTNFMSSAQSGARITGETTPVHRGRSTMVWQTRISTEDGKLVALVTQTQIVLPAA
jgi:1,4-dihydroxy-2-naphthoyl-CoA hydrolase